MHFFGRPQPPAPTVTANGQQMPVVNSITLLGTFGSSLKWHLHINKITSKASSVCYFLIVLRRSAISQEHLIRFYTTFIRPKLEYAAPAWHSSLPQSLSNQLETVQQMALRLYTPTVAIDRRWKHPACQPHMTEGHLFV